MGEPRTPYVPPAFRYDGRVYVRPVSRGVIMLDLPQELYVEDCVHDGYYRMQITFEALSGEEVAAAEELMNKPRKPPEDTG